MNKITVAVLVVSGLLAAPLVHAEPGDWYLTPSAVYFDDDGRRLLDDSLAGGQIVLGREMSDRFSLEGLLGYSDIAGFPGQEHLEGGVNVVGSLAPYSSFSPYVVAGVGYLWAETTTGFKDDRPTGNLGLGFKWRFGDSRWALRGEYRWRNAWDSDGSLTDRIGTLGLQFGFGEGRRSLPDPEPAAEPIDEPPPPPPPPESDSDGDGVPDSRDSCPGTARGTRVNSSGCPADTDQDGVTDDRDECPGTVAGVRVDSKGCEIRETIELDGVQFENNSEVLLPGAEQVLSDAAETLLMNPDLVVEIAGHTDSNGEADFNMNLSLRRAYAVRWYLVDAGVNPDNLSVRGYGESNPIASNTTEAGRAQNRRVELRVMNR